MREEAIYWASARVRGAGLEPAAWGRIARDPARDVDEQLAALSAAGFGRELRCEAALRAAGAVHERTPLPALSRSEAGEVARRRAAAFAERLGPGACTASSRARREARTTLWFAGVDGGESEQCRRQWLQRGFTLERLQSRHLALGRLTRCLPGLVEGEVVAIFDIERATGTCVLADLDGWIFSREVPLRFMGRSSVARVEEPVAAADPLALEINERFSGLGLVAPPKNDEDERDPLEDIAAQAERLATELRRTFRYAEGHLGAAPVARVVLAGEITELIDLRPGLGEHLQLPVEVLAEHAEGEEQGRPIGGAAVVLGMACAPDTNGGNLLPAGARREISGRRTRRRLARALVAAILVVGAGGLATALELESLGSRLVELDAVWLAGASDRARLSGARQSRDRARALEEALAALDAPGPSPVALLRALAHEMPEEAALQRLALEPDGGGWRLLLRVEARGPTMALAAQSVSDFVRGLDGAPFARIDRVEREAADGTPADPSSGARVHFRLEGRLAPIERLAAAGRVGR